MAAITIRKCSHSSIANKNRLLCRPSSTRQNAMSPTACRNILCLRCILRIRRMSTKASINTCTVIRTARIRWPMHIPNTIIAHRDNTDSRTEIIVIVLGRRGPALMIAFPIHLPFTRQIERLPGLLYGVHSKLTFLTSSEKIRIRFENTSAGCV